MQQVKRDHVHVKRNEFVGFESQMQGFRLDSARACRGPIGRKRGGQGLRASTERGQSSIDDHGPAPCGSSMTIPTACASHRGRSFPREGHLRLLGEHPCRPPVAQPTARHLNRLTLELSSFRPRASITAQGDRSGERGPCASLSYRLFGELSAGSSARVTGLSCITCAALARNGSSGTDRCTERNAAPVPSVGLLPADK